MILSPRSTSPRWLFAISNTKRSSNMSRFIVSSRWGSSAPRPSPAFGGRTRSDGKPTSHVLTSEVDPLLLDDEGSVQHLRVDRPYVLPHDSEEQQLHTPEEDQAD